MTSTTPTTPAAYICTSSTNGEPVWWPCCTCGWEHPERSTEEDTPAMLDQWREHHNQTHPGTHADPAESASTPVQVCPYCDATDETCPAAKTERACCECIHPGIDH